MNCMTEESGLSRWLGTALTFDHSDRESEPDLQRTAPLYLLIRTLNSNRSCLSFARLLRVPRIWERYITGLYVGSRSVKLQSMEALV